MKKNTSLTINFKFIIGEETINSLTLNALSCLLSTDKLRDQLLFDGSMQL